MTSSLIWNLNKELISSLHKEFPEAEVLYKTDSLWCKFLGFLIRIITFGQYKDWDKMSITVGYKIFLAERFDPVDYYDPDLYKLLRHERVHLLQYEKHPIWHTISYLLVLPLVWTERSKTESEAYTQSVLASIYVRILLNINPEPAKEPIREFLWEEFRGIDYLFMCPFRKKFNLWFEKVWAAGLIKENMENLNFMVRI